jgi:hypothetical protein
VIVYPALTGFVKEITAALWITGRAAGKLMKISIDFIATAFPV